MEQQDRRRALVAQTTRLVEFLRELARTGKPVMRDLDRYQMVRWLADLPDELMVLTDAGPGETLLSVDPVPSEPPPLPPPEVARWVSGRDVQDSSLEAPELSDEIPDTLWADVEDRYWPWVERWQVWAEADRRIAPRREWHADLLRVARQLEQQDDRYEAVVGVGVVTWTANGNQIRHPLVTTRVEVLADASSGRVDVVVPAEAVTRFNDRWLLDGMPGFDPVVAQDVRDEARARVPQPLGDDLKDALSRWQAAALDRALPYQHDWQPRQAGVSGPEVRFAPVLVLRERDRTGLIDYLDRMLEALSGPDATAPLGLAQLLTAIESDERMAWLESEGAASGSVVGDDPLFPLPANPEQRRIIDRLRTDNGVVVMGPPGTGKTHTIANLVSALLARGQRVLVTSQKAQALRVLRGQMPDEIQKLCVSMTDVGRGGSTELNESVTALSDRFSTYSERDHRQRVSRLERERDGARSQVSALRERIRALREAETFVHPRVADGYEGTRARIAERLRQQADACEWIPVPLPPDAPVDPPLTVDELVELRRLVMGESPRRRERARQVFPELASLPSRVDVETLIHDERLAHEVARQEATELSGALGGLDSEALANLRAQINTGQSALHALGLGASPTAWPDDWSVRAIRDGLARRDRALWQQVVDVANQAHRVHDAVRKAGLRQVTLPEFGSVGPDSLAAQLEAGRALREHLAAGNQLKRRLRPTVQKQAQVLLDGAFVDGVPISNVELLDLVLAVLDAEQTTAGLAARWAVLDVHLDMAQPLDRRLSELRDLADALHHVMQFLRVSDEIQTWLAGHDVQVVLRSPGDWHALAEATDAVEARLAADRVTHEMSALAARLDLMARDPGAPPEVGRLATAVAERDVNAYADALLALAGAPAEQADQRRCDELETRLSSTHPALAGELRRTAGDSVWETRFASFAAAWAWGKAITFFNELRAPGLEERLAGELQDATSRVGTATASLAAELAWGACLSRMTAHQQQALLSYKAQIDAKGKGTGKWAHRFSAGAREAMIEAREAVPAWIMPIGDVVDTVPPDKNSFDVVIVDEASQASIEAVFLLWLAPRVIVVGDERQCAPSQVVRGELQPIFDRLDTYLGDVPEYLRTMFTPKTDLFTLLQTRFGATIRLREHFRCMPEIIGWSSQQFYADAPLVPLRQFGADRLPPLRVVHVPGAVNEGSSTSLRNRAEAEAIVEQIAACIDDPAYDGLSMGVVVLQGNGHVRLIDELLEERLPAAVREARHIRVGSPPDFQGDQRHVMFLSMVAAERRSAFTSREWQRRFNVAASRARDQMWLFHSVTLDLLSPNDLRRSLLGYMTNPPAPLATERFDDLRWDSPRREPFDSMFEQRVFIALRDRGYAVTPQYEVNGRRIDLVVTGAKGRLAVECDGDYWHSAAEDQLADIDREQELSRAGWRFWRVRESEFYLDPDAALESLWTTLDERGIRPGDLSGLGDEPIPSEATAVWSPTELASEEGLDGLDGADPSELDADPGRLGRASAGRRRHRGSRPGIPATAALAPTSRPDTAPRSAATGATASTAEVRDWARDRGMRVGERGRLNPRVISEWNREHPDRPLR